MYYAPHLLSFAATASLLVAAPGVDTAMVLRTAAADGRRAGIAVAVGIGVGCLCWGAAVAFGLDALLRTSPLAFNALKFAGALFLFVLGIRLLRKGRSAPPTLPATSTASKANTMSALRRGFTGNILNPKVGLFYVTLVPQFVPAMAPVTIFSLVLTGIHVLLALIWFVVLAMGAAIFAPFLRRPPVARGLDLATGCVFLGFAAELALLAS